MRDNTLIFTKSEVQYKDYTSQFVGGPTKWKPSFSGIQDGVWADKAILLVSIWHPDESFNTAVIKYCGRLGIPLEQRYRMGDRHSE